MADLTDEALLRAELKGGRRGGGNGRVRLIRGARGFRAYWALFDVFCGKLDQFPESLVEGPTVHLNQVLHGNGTHTCKISIPVPASTLTFIEYLCTSS